MLNDEGEVIATTRSDRNGRYSFNQFGETGDFQVRVVPPASLTVTTANPQSFLIASGDVTVRRVNFGLRAVTSSVSASSALPRVAHTEGNNR